MAEWWLGPTTPDQCGQNPVYYYLTSGEVLASFLTDSCAPETDLSEVLLDLDLIEDLLEVLGVLVEASLVAFWDSVSHCSSYHKR